MFSNTDIERIKDLVISPDIQNNLLAFEFIKSNGVIPELKTALYLLYNRFVLEELRSEKKKALALLQQYVQNHYEGSLGQKISLTVLFEDVQYSFKKDLHKQFKQQDAIINWDKSLIAQTLPNYVDTKHWGKTLAGFVFKYSDKDQQERVIELLKSKDYLGRVQLDLGGIGLQEMPLVAFDDSSVKVLHIWGNELSSLPNTFAQYPDLEILNLANNQLRELPNSISKLKKLEQFFAQNNLFEPDLFIEKLQQLPSLKKLYITVSHLDNEPAAKLANFAYLVNENKLTASIQEQQLCLFLFLRDQKARKQLSLEDFFWGANHSLKEIRKQSIKHILSQEGKHQPIVAHSSIALLGKMSQLTNMQFNSIQQHFSKHDIETTTYINENTSHIVLGEYPDNYELIKERSFSFLAEQDFLATLKKIKG
ncbi:MAG: leucine-rich repeat domain-containing protein [Aureispira sp.]|nr:leucine-rich repeat domain-containing protein [Aureispira sp.]